MKPWSKIAGYLVSLSVLVLLWDGILRLGLVNADLLPTPVAVLWSLVKLGVSPDFWLDISVTFARSLLGLLGGALVAIPLGTLMALQKPVRGFFEPLVKASYSLPKIALIPLLILWFGVGTTTTVLAVLNHPLISATAKIPLNSFACDTAFANRSMSGRSLCSGMFGISS